MRYSVSLPQWFKHVLDTSVSQALSVVKNDMSFSVLFKMLCFNHNTTPAPAIATRMWCSGTDWIEECQFHCWIKWHSFTYLKEWRICHMSSNMYITDTLPTRERARWNCLFCHEYTCTSCSYCAIIYVVVAVFCIQNIVIIISIV